MSRNFSSIGAFLDHLRSLPAKVQEAQKVGMEEAGQMLVTEAKLLIGTEDHEWPDLAESTVTEKERLGYTDQVSPTDPLLRTGEMANSIEHKVEGNTVIVGSDSDVALWQEHGTTVNGLPHIPPRPFISTAMFRYGDEATHIIAKSMMDAFSGKPVRSMPKGGKGTG